MKINSNFVFVLTMLLTFHNVIFFSFNKLSSFSNKWLIASGFRNDASNDFVKSRACLCPLLWNTSFRVGPHQRLKSFWLWGLKIKILQKMKFLFFPCKSVEAFCKKRNEAIFWRVKLLSTQVSSKFWIDHANVAEQKLETFSFKSEIICGNRGKPSSFFFLPNT